MLMALQSLIGFITCIGLLVSVHEWAHFCVARAHGITVERFSIGFGPVLFSRRDSLGTQFSLSLIPLGGYVKMLGDNEQDSLKPGAFKQRSPWVRMQVVLAGPLSNFILAFICFCLMFLLGMRVQAPVVSADFLKPQSPYLVTHYQQQAIDSFEELSLALMQDISQGRAQAELKMRPFEGGAVIKHSLQLGPMLNKPLPADFLPQLGLQPFDPIPATIGRVLPDGPAEAAGLQAGDTIIKLDQVTVSSRRLLLEQLAPRPNEKVSLTFDRGGHLHVIELKTGQRLQADQARGVIGVVLQAQALPAGYWMLQRSDLIDALPRAFQRLCQYSALTFKFLVQTLTGQQSIKTLGGPISIAEQAGHAMDQGFVAFLSFLALISISLGVLNLFPIPALDGGQFCLLALEWLRGKPLAGHAQVLTQWVGLLMIGTLMSLAVVNDVLKFWPRA